MAVNDILNVGAIVIK